MPRNSVKVVQALERVLGGDPVTEAMVLRFIGEAFGAPTLFEVPALVSSTILSRPGDWLRSVREHLQPELHF